MSPHVGFMQMDATSVRQANLRQESNIKMLGAWDIVVGGLTTVIVFFVTVGFILGDPPPPPPGQPQPPKAFFVGISFLYLLLCTLQLVAGIGLRMLQGWGRIAGNIVHTICLLNFPCGTFFNAFFLAFLNNQNASFIFSPEYRHIVAKTPHIKPLVSVVVIVMVSLLLFLIFAGVALAVAAAIFA